MPSGCCSREEPGLLRRPRPVTTSALPAIVITFTVPLARPNREIYRRRRNAARIYADDVPRHVFAAFDLTRISSQWNNKRELSSNTAKATPVKASAIAFRRDCSLIASDSREPVDDRCHRATDFSGEPLERSQRRKLVEIKASLVSEFSSTLGIFLPRVKRPLETRPSGFHNFPGTSSKMYKLEERSRGPLGKLIFTDAGDVYFDRRLSSWGGFQRFSAYSKRKLQGREEKNERNFVP